MSSRRATSPSTPDQPYETKAKFFMLKHNKELQKLEEKIRKDVPGARLRVYLDDDDRITLRLLSDKSVLVESALCEPEDDEEIAAEGLVHLVNNWDRLGRPVLKRAQEQYGERRQRRSGHHDRHGGSQRRHGKSENSSHCVIS